MITLDNYARRTVGVFGLSRSGAASVVSLLAGGAHVYAWDDTEETRGKLAQVCGQDPNLHLVTPETWPWQVMSFLVMSPGVPLTHPMPHPVVVLANARGCPLISDIELMVLKQADARATGVTGTNGKSTTTTLIAHILKTAGYPVAAGGNLGTAALSLPVLGEGGAYVLELSSYQLDLLQCARFPVAVWLNISADHLDRHGSMEGYIAAKKKIFARQRLGDIAIIGVDDEASRAVHAEQQKIHPGQVIAVSAASQLEKGVFAENGVIYDRLQQKELTLDISGIPTLTGRHNWQNAAAAYAAARAMGVAPEVIGQAMRTFPGLAHRMESVAAVQGVRFINDSKATNADATANALASYDPIYWILGGKAKAGGITSLTRYFPRIAHAFLIGEAAEEFAAVLRTGGVAFTMCETLENATREAAAKAFAERRKDAVVLLSPACASFDQWKNFEERGDAFRTQAQALQETQAA